MSFANVSQASLQELLIFTEIWSYHLWVRNSQTSPSAVMEKHASQIFLLSTILKGSAVSACYTSEEYHFRTDIS